MNILFWLTSSSKMGFTMYCVVEQLLNSKLKKNRIPATTNTPEAQI